MVVERRGDLRVLAGTPAEAEVTFYQGGMVADPGTVTLSARRADGDVFTPAASVAGSGAAPRTLALSIAETSQIDVIDLTWTSESLGALTTRVETVGDRIFTIDELRAFGGDRIEAAQGLHNAARYPVAAIEDARRRVEDGFEEICEVAFFPRLKIATLSGDGSCSIFLPGLRTTEVRFVQVRSGSAWTDFTEDELADLDLSLWGELSRYSGTWARGRRNVRVGFVHGYERVPEEIRRAGLILARTQLIESNVSDRNMSVSSEDGTFRLATAGVTRGSWYGLPLVDSVLARYREHVPAVG